MAPSLRKRTHLVPAVVAAFRLGAASLQAKDSAPAIRIAVDLREAPRRIFHALLVIPATPGPLTLVYPQWIPGEHAPGGPLADLAGLKFSAAGKPRAWRRDNVDIYAFHLEVPAGADPLKARLYIPSPHSHWRFLSQPGSDGAVGRAQLESRTALPPRPEERRRDLSGEPALAGRVEVRHRAARRAAIG